jgi:TPP-dependent indolepyruvate ferredoxin oxidoreductase alpha subunit
MSTITEIVALAIRDAGAKVVTHVPGIGGTEVFAAFSQISSETHSRSFHEEVAYTIAHGASLVGKRSATLIKAHGLAKAANSVVDSLSAGTTAGFVVLVFDDRFSKHSDCIFNVPELLQGLEIPYRRLQLHDTYRQVQDAFTLSESLQLPVAILINTDDLGEMETYTPLQRVVSSRNYKRNVVQHIVGPFFPEYQRQVLEAKLTGQNWQMIKAPTPPTIPDALPNVLQPIVRLYVPLFSVFKKLRGDIVTGDTSTSTIFASPPYRCVDICTYIGGSIPLAIGACLAGYKNTWALTGDFSFIAAGHLGLIEAIQRNIPLKVLIFNNEKAQATGGQPVPIGILDRILTGYEPYLREIHNPQDASEIETVLQEASQAKEMRIVVADYRGG